MMDWYKYRVMGILNLTPDSFVAETRRLHLPVDRLLAQVQQMLADGMDILDIGAESTRPGATALTPEQEWDRLATPLREIRAAFPALPISIDTYHPETAERVISAGADIINDISGGCDAMDAIVARARVPYILTYAGAGDMIGFFARRVDCLHRLGAADVILDPGFGFGKSTAQCWETLRDLRQLQVFDLPVLAGLSRKSMLWRVLNITPDEAQEATTAANMLALREGAHILRVHDVKMARQCITLYETLLNPDKI